MPKSKHIRAVLAALRRADADFSLIDEGDRIALGLSGGKDSLCLLYALSLYGRFAGKKFKVYPVFMDLGFGNVDIIALKEYCASLGYELTVNDSAFVYDVLKAHQEKGKHLPCSICSRMKKAAINAEAKRLRCNKVAFAHHQDDAVETLFMNMVHGGRVATFSPKMVLRRSGLTFIRPLIYCHEKQLIDLAKEMELPVLKSACPADGHTDREEVKHLLQDIYKKYPEAEKNFGYMLKNHEAFDLYFDDIELEGEVPTGYSVSPVVLAKQMRGLSLSNEKEKDGESDYLIKRDHEVVGEVALVRLLPHRYGFYYLKGEDEDLVKGLSILMERLSKEICPLTFVIERGHPKLAKKLGFAYGPLPGSGKKAYFKKVG